MRYGSRGSSRAAPGDHGLVAGARHGVAPLTPPATSHPHDKAPGSPATDAPDAAAQPNEPPPHRPNAPASHSPPARGTPAKPPKPFNFKRLEWSCTLVGVFGCLILAAPIYLLYGRMAACLNQHDTHEHLAHGPLGQSLRFVQIIVGLLGIFILPILGRERRGRVMTWLGVAILALLFLLLEHTQPLFEIFVDYSSVALLSLISLDAVTNVRPAVRRSARLARLQLVAAAAVTVLWFLPAIVTLTDHQINAVVSVPLSPWAHLALRIGAMTGELTGLTALAGAIVPYHRALQIICRGLGSLALALIMGLALYLVIQRAHLLGNVADWRGIEYLWLFLSVAGALTLIWAGLMQRLLLNAADIQQAGGEE